MQDRTAHATTRIIGEYDSNTPGPRIVILAGVHGNEHAGVEAAKRIFTALGTMESGVQGRIIAIRGNLPALGREARFIDCDLNRMWSGATLDALALQDPADDNTEQSEQRELLCRIEKEIQTDRKSVVFLDLHSTSAPGIPFVIIGDTLRNRRIAFPLRLPVILGFEEAIEGTLDEYFGARGLVHIVVEGGQHGDPTTVDNLEAIIWLTLTTSGLISHEQVPGIDGHRSRIRDAGGGVSAVVELVHRHGTEDGDGFHMDDDHINFETVRSGQRLASDRSGAIVTPKDGMLLLPNYQNIGNDGFFVGRRVRKFWLRFSAMVRHLGADRYLPLLPGVRREPGSDVVYANRKVARWLTVKIFHLFGFRKCRRDGDILVFTRRPERPV
ncbi:MAG: succinylglutamate desuccinylase/aspartoacylase family protein [bacterium]|nr:succinylglutamate desuccinylase/aspartoacylase family protein [bacterium]